MTFSVIAAARCVQWIQYSTVDEIQANAIPMYIEYGSAVLEMVYPFGIMRIVVRFASMVALKRMFLGCVLFAQICIYVSISGIQSSHRNE
jgi:hypothetical protein